MSEFSSPTQIAREALRRLAVKRLAPTPENFRELYHTIAGDDATAAPHSDDYLLRVSINALLATGRHAVLAAALTEAADERTWPKARAALIALSKAQLDAPVAGSPSAAPPASTQAPAPAAKTGNGAAAPAENPLLREMLVRLLESRISSHLSRDDDLLLESRLLAGRVRNAYDDRSYAALADDLRRYGEQVDVRVEEASALRDGLHRLVRLLVDNVRELIVEDTWISHQLEVVREIMDKPVETNTVEEAERFLREVLQRQGSLKQGLQDTKTALRDMVREFIEKLGTMSTDTGEFGRKIEKYTERIRGTEDVRSLGALLGDLLSDTQDMQSRAAAAQREIEQARDTAQAAERRIGELETQLLHVSEKVREDHLTGALNRRGFEEAFMRETARARRSGKPLCVALLDIDDFKLLNDRHGHHAGDDALVHLVRAARETLRPNDVVARHGGEEFLILLPETTLPEAEATVIRLQRELTRRIFLRDNERVLITFSAGVGMWMAHEGKDAILARVDAAQYRAKRAGKNRVVQAEPPPSA